jgi:hypothetical protein
LNPRQTAIVATVVLLALAGIVILLLTGGPGEPAASIEDATGDVSVTGGDEPPTNAPLVDIHHAEVTKDGNDLVFVTSMGATIPGDMGEGELNWRWTISVGGRNEWLLSSRVNVEPNASIVSQRTQYAAGTIDKTMPGDITIEGDTVTITLDPSQIDGFPAEFDWALQATLDRDLKDPGSGVLQDLAPDSGSGHYSAN